MPATWRNPSDAPREAGVNKAATKQNLKPMLGSSSGPKSRVDSQASEGRKQGLNKQPPPIARQNGKATGGPSKQEQPKQTPKFSAKGNMSGSAKKRLAKQKKASVANGTATPASSCDTPASSAGAADSRPAAGRVNCYDLEVIVVKGEK